VLKVATRFEAGQVLEGSIVQAGSQLTLNAWLRRVPGGEETERVTVTGPADSIAVLQYRLAMQLLGSQLGETTERVESFADRDPRAVMAYLAGVQAFRAGKWPEAHRELSRAQSLDPDFALAALWLAYLRLQLPGETFDQTLARQEASLRRAIALRDRLGARERAWLDQMRIARDRTTTGVATLEATQRWVELAPDDADAQYWYSYLLWSVGALASVPDWERRFKAARLRAWELDSTTPGRIQEMLWDGVVQEDPEWVRRVAPAYFAHTDSTAEMWTGWRWFMAHVNGDSETVRELRTRASDGDPSVLTFITTGILREANRAGWIPAADLELMSRERLARGDSSRIPMGIELGRVGAAAEWWMARRDPINWAFVVEWSFAYPGMDSAAAVAADSLRAFVRRVPPRTPTGQRPDSPPAFECACLADLYQTAHGDTVGVRASAAALAPLYAEVGWQGICPALIEAMLETAGGSATTPALDRVEAMLRRGQALEWPLGTGLLFVARLARQRGDLARALRAAGDRGSLGYNPTKNLLPGYLKEEGELAAQIGDTARAIKAYSHYLLLWNDPDPGPMQSQIDSVRTALDALLRTRG
jgi:hypothetical protein